MTVSGDVEEVEAPASVTGPDSRPAERSHGEGGAVQTRAIEPATQLEQA